MKKIVLLFFVIITTITISVAGGKKKINNSGQKEENSVPDTAALDPATARVDSILATIQFQTGQVTVGSNIASVDVPGGFVFLSAKEAQKILSGVWHNPLDTDVLGLLMPKGESFLADSAWVIVYSYEEDGHVKDDDAADIKYDDLLAQIKKATEEANAGRTAQGYTAMHLVGWAAPPYYDKQNHKLHWAKELKVDNIEDNTLNYNIRMLGRKGVLVLNVVASMSNLKDVQKNMDKILASTNFTKGNTYSDYSEGIDKVAEYGVAGLIAGGVLLKTGLLAKLGLLLVASWKIIMGVVVATFTFLRKKIFGGGNKPQ